MVTRSIITCIRMMSPSWSPSSATRTARTRRRMERETKESMRTMSEIRGESFYLLFNIMKFFKIIMAVLVIMTLFPTMSVDMDKCSTIVIYLASVLRR